MGGGRDFATGQSIYIRRNGIYYRRDGKEVKHRGGAKEKEKEIPATLKNFNGNTNVGQSQYEDMSEAEKREIQEGLKAIREYIDKGDFRIRVTKRAMNGILDSGEIMNQMQVGDSRGYYDPDERRYISQRLFGHDGNLANEEYEKYGYLSDGQTDAAYWYGDFDIVLKKDALMDRTTMTLGDSLDYNVEYPSFVSNPQWISSGRGKYADPGYFNEKAHNLLLTGKFEDDYDGYLELQFHGKLTTNEIDHISMKESWKNDPPAGMRDIIEKIENTGIKIKYDARG